MQCHAVCFIWKLLYMSRMVIPPIIRSANNYLQHLVFVTPLLLPTAIVEELELVCVCCQHTQTCSNFSTIAADGWRYYPKHVEQFPDKINCVTFHLVGYILEYYYDARTHER
jgi:hypothetical protein